jgi:hypothetical protein
MLIIVTATANVGSINTLTVAGGTKGTGSVGGANGFDGSAGLLIVWETL